MKRVVWGAILAAFGVLCLTSAGNNPQGPAGSIVTGLLCLMGGAAISYFGSRYVKNGRTIAESALAMLKERGKIDTADLAQRVRLSEVTLRLHLANAQRAGIIPFKAEVV